MRTAALLLGALLVGSITLTHDAPSTAVSADEPVVRMGALAPGSTGGLNGSAGNASVAGALVTTTTDLLYLNNTGSDAWHARLVVASSSGLSGLTSLTVGIDNGTRVPQVVGSLGSLTQTGGSYVRLEAGSANKLYVTQLTALGAPTATLTLQVYASDATDDSAYVVTSLVVRVT